MRLRESEEGDVAVNGLSVIAQLLEAVLLDRLFLAVVPKFVGRGRRLFGEGLTTPIGMELIQHSLSERGHLLLTRRRRGCRIRPGRLGKRNRPLRASQQRPVSWSG
ncbi:dihydrofolate reductase family protein [Aestuariimicrobium ganziense]|uniref:dihydrofolate reductase family protein n=1 Tax=Aestuariimicrobium ganziense TaxID=2773677 RepID=UPI001941923B|nr:dihydrofolate reductase family protein [Aestuariimicrobium ganziense]